MSESQI